MEDMKKVGKTGGLALLYFEVVSTVALIVGLVVVNVVQPGAGMNVDPKRARHQGDRGLHRSRARCRARSTSC
jgi:aerobic C4-dicarboxylate transport protein